MKKLSICKKCGERIEWVQLREGWRPLNPDLTPHFDTCTGDNLQIKEPLQIGKNSFVS